MANTKKMVIAVYGNLYIGNIDTEKLHSQGGFLVTATDEEIQEAIKDIYWLDVRVIRQDIRYENILLGEDVQLCVYATGDIQVGSRMSMMSTRSASPTLDYPVFYALQGSILNAPLNTQEVYKLLGIGKHKGEWWDIGYICSNQHGKTDKWSQNKPVRFAGPDNGISATWYRGDDGKCGYDITVANDAATIVSQIFDGNNTWEYLPPRVGVDFSRLPDFIGYDHSCVAPFYNPINQSGIVAAGNAMVQRLLSNNQAIDNHRNINPFTDIMLNGKLISDWHYACVVVSTSGSKVVGFCAPSPIKTQKVVTLLMEPTYFSATSPGSYYLIPLIVSTYVGTCNFAAGNKWPTSAYYSTLPIKKAVLTTYPRSYIMMSGDAEYSYYNGVKNGISWSLYGTNRTDSPIEIGELIVSVWYKDRTEEGERSVKVYEYEERNENRISIPAQTVNYDTHLGGNILSSLITGWNTSFDYFMEIESTNELLGKITVNVS